VKIDGRTSLGRQDQLGQNQRKTPEIHFLTLLMRIEMKFHFKTESSNPKSAILRKRPISKHFKGKVLRTHRFKSERSKPVKPSQTQSNQMQPPLPHPVKKSVKKWPALRRLSSEALSRPASAFGGSRRRCFRRRRVNFLADFDHQHKRALSPRGCPDRVGPNSN
jgi:hypothetical protein